MTQTTVPPQAPFIPTNPDAELREVMDRLRDERSQPSS